MRYLIDTTLLIDHAKSRPGVGALVESLFAEPNDLLVCDVVVAEALSGGDELELATIRALVASLEYVATHPEAAIRAGETRSRLGLTSARGLADAIIGGIAWFDDAIVVTRNPEDFEVQGVRALGYG
ncbi:MAG TPA: PIN domain-containing protein [Candidatus Limnocylindrales bacterium]|jgi:predicted nucleic acid-binding protein|nr:PIN domain-containing protein [Candidatus Limnocylindrales bacterium]